MMNAPAAVAADTSTPQVRTPRAGIALIALGAFAVEIAVSGRYGYVRDELYFLALGHHLSFGYVDQPPLLPLLARGISWLTGNTLVGLRVLPALMMSAMVLATAAMSRMLGASRAGQLFAALAAALCSEYLGVMHELITTAPDYLLEAVMILLVMRLLASQDPRWWIAIGGCVGVGSEVKWNIAFLAAGLVAGLLAALPRDSMRTLLRSRYLLIGAVIAAGLAAPDLIWQAVHGWPVIGMDRELQTAAGSNRASYWLVQVLFTGPVLTLIWLRGLIWSLRGQAAARRFRPVAIGCALVIMAQFVLGGKGYYPGAAYTFLLAAGTVPLRRGPSGRGARVALTALLAVSVLAFGLIGVISGLPVLPARTLRTTQLQKVNDAIGDQIGWPALAATIAAGYRAVPSGQRRYTAILTGNYGEAAAVDRYGPGLGLPQAYCGSNSFWYLGPPPAADTAAIAVNVGPALLHLEFASVRRVATFYNGLGVSDGEQGAPIYLVTGLKSSWARAWPAFRGYEGA
ncbi:MAG TPA: glycosyltransferase family 39 protein [Streptosporangiaceae bacterium]|jgi:4-amino-4-deoxy-L-arabinose transferase-like glycosyltransferase